MTNRQAKRFLCGGAVDPARQVYVVRDADRQAYNLLEQGNHVNLHSGRQAGKTSLMLSLKDRLTATGHLCLDVELSVIFSGADLLEGGAPSWAVARSVSCCNAESLCVTRVAPQQAWRQH